MRSHHVREPAKHRRLAAVPMPMLMSTLALMVMIMAMLVIVIDLNRAVAVWVGHNAQDGRRSAFVREQPVSASSLGRPTAFFGICWQAP
jgi:hypothetical protein